MTSFSFEYFCKINSIKKSKLMKKLIVMAILLIAGSTQMNAQLKLGIKGGVNFANVDGGPDGIDYKSKTGFHAGAVAEIKFGGNLAIQPELLYSSQGTKIEGAGDFNLDYVSVPVLVKYYIISDLLSIEAGPQFSFLVDDSNDVAGDIGDGGDNKSFDFAVAGGIGLNITKSLFAQARYTVGLTEVSKNADIKNSVFQLSVGYMLF